MGPISSITKTLQKAIDFVTKPEDYFEDRGRSIDSVRSTGFAPRRRSSTRKNLESASKSRGRSRNRSPTGTAGRPIDLLKDSPRSGSEVSRLSSTKSRRGRRRSLQKSLNHQVETLNSPTVPIMAPKWQAKRNLVGKGSPRNEHEKEVRANFEKLKKKRWDDLTEDEKEDEIAAHLENKRRTKAWNLEKDYNRQLKKVERTAEEAAESARVAESAARRLERLKQRKGEASPKPEKRSSKPKKTQEELGQPISENPSIRLNGAEGPANSNGRRSVQQAAESGRGSNAPGLSRQPQESSNSQNRPESHRSSTAPTSSADPAKAESAVLRRPSRPGRSNTMPSQAGESEAQSNSQQGGRSGAQSRAHSSSKNTNGGIGAQEPSRAATVRDTAKQSLHPTQLRQLTNANEAEGSSSRLPGQSRGVSQVSKIQKESQPAKSTVKPRQQPQAAENSKSSDSRAQQQQSEKQSTLKQSRTRRTTLAPLTKQNLESTSPEYVLESESVYEVKTVLNRGLGDNMRTIIEGMISKTPSELEEEEEERNEKIREKLEEAEMREQDKLLATKFHRGLGDNFRTLIEGMQPMTSEDIKAEERNWKSQRRRQLEAEEQAEQDKLLQTEFNRGLGDMMRTNIEAMIPMTTEQLRQEVREKLEDEEMRLQDELVKTKFNRGLGDNMRTVIEGLVSKSPGSMTPEEIRRKKEAYAAHQTQRRIASSNASKYNSES